jgi:hypothetical protein
MKEIMVPFFMGVHCFAHQIIKLCCVSAFKTHFGSLIGGFAFGYVCVFLIHLKSTLSFTNYVKFSWKKNQVVSKCEDQMD